MPTYSQSTSFSSFSSTVNGQRTSYQEHRHSDNGGTTVRTRTEEHGQEPVEQERYYPGSSGGLGSQRLEGRQQQQQQQSQGRIEDVTDKEEGQEKYEEKMEDEYAKREGGA
jgi:hypothetical protein